ncbi:hypothetical protein C8F04DRAFT_1192750 [Mycena alexandri]|uniref:CxC2-like cysteine cluster KDZ transposase-associated domain-containing protein n=1 Tax=Mycena alexandri TaxID=1745969 RepID=A0AAD6SAQ9_9AGAR|nr:hypothetical protein C8F04DRAFT_1192750 [Mycena alexandri]
MSKLKFTVTSTVYSDSDGDTEDELPRMVPMRNDETVMVGGRIKHNSWYIDVEGSPGKLPRDWTPAPDLLYPDVAPDPGFEVPDWIPGTSSVGEAGFAFDDGHPVDAGPREARKSDRPLEVWMEDDLEEFADEILRCEGQGDYYDQVRCAECQVPGIQAHRCQDCFTDALFCANCMVRLHADHPFHVLERSQTWDGTLFERNTLRHLGLRIQLGHKRGVTCPGVLARTPAEWEKSKEDSFCIVDDKVIHEVALDFCTCGTAAPRAVQLLRAQLYPATTVRPSSAATFRVLRRFHKLSFEAKCSAYEFYNALARETNNTGNFQPRRVSTDDKRVATSPGPQALGANFAHERYPEHASRRPGKNLPPNGDWRAAPPHKRFLYALFLAIDANFRMKRKQVSSEESDPGLNNGAMFFSEVTQYMAHVKEHWETEQEVNLLNLHLVNLSNTGRQKSRCVSHDAVNQPDKEAQRYGFLGYRHRRLREAQHEASERCRGPPERGAVLELKEHERDRYINMDWMFWKSLDSYDDLVQLVVSYDIVCQWRINIWRRLENYKPELRRNARTGERYYMWLIPKFHLPAHIEACNILYSFNLTPSGTWLGERKSFGSKYEGDGAWRSTRHLDDHFNDWNHKKIVALGRVMLERIQKAVGQMVEKQQELVEVEASLPTDIVKSWTEAMELWEKDSTKPNPFNVAEKHATVQAVRGRIAQEAGEAVEGDTADDVRGDLHAYEMLAMGMQLEQQQRELACDIAALKNHASDSQKTTVLERGNKLRRKIASWIKIQTDFQPGRAARMQPTAGIAVHALELWLPSKQVKRPGAEVKATHIRYEFDMRQAHAHEALDEVRNLLLVRTHQYKYKDAGNESGVAGKTRLQSGIEILDERIWRAAEDYCAAHRALSSLGPRLKETKWALVLKPLAADDVRGMPRALFSDPERKGRGKKRKRDGAEQPPAPPPEMLWIWRTGVSTLAAAASTSEEAVIKATNESLRVEWAKTRARAHRWTEEVDLLEEEMRLYHRLPRMAGVVAVIQEKMKARFEGNWKDVARWIALGREGVSDIQAASRSAEGEEEDEEDQATDDDADEPVPLVARNAVAVSTSLVEGQTSDGAKADDYPIWVVDVLGKQMSTNGKMTPNRGIPLIVVHVEGDILIAGNKP